MGLVRLSKMAEFAPGLPEKGKITPLPKVKKPEVWQLSAHPHEAERAGEHIDLRLGNPSSGIAHSFVLPKAQLPDPGKARQVIPTSDHTLPYMDWTGAIQAGYGKGKVKPGRRTVAEVYHADPSDEPGTKLRFNLYDTRRPEEYSIRKDDQGRWFLHNKTQTRERRPDLPAAKPKYKEIPVDKVDPTNEQQAMMPKLDGAHAIIDLRAGKAPRVYSYRVGKTTGTGLIEHTHKMPELLTRKVPKELDGTVLRAEIVGIKTASALQAISGSTLGGALNSKVWESRKKQDQGGFQLQAFPFSVVRYNGRDMENAPFEEKAKILRMVARALPGLEPPPLATTPEEKSKMLDAIKNKAHPLTEEGVVLVDRNQPGVPIKAKFAPDHDVYVRKIHPAVSKSGETHDRAGAVSYSRTPTGPVVGRVGGFKHQEARDMLANPDKYIGRAAKVTAPREFDRGTLFQPRFKEWHLDKGDIEKRATYEGLVDELEKISRSYLKDFAAGVDPTGTKTFEYGMKDAPVTEQEASKRRAIGVAGGILGGATVVPSAVSGIIGGVKAIKRGPLAMARGFGHGAISPYQKLYRAARGERALKTLHETGTVSPSQAEILGKVLPGDPRLTKALTGDASTMSKIKNVLGQQSQSVKDFEELRNMAIRHPGMIDALRAKIRSKGISALSGMGISGAVGGGSAYLQYGKGRKTGQIMSPEQREQATS